MGEHSDSERAAEATRRAIARITGQSRRRGKRQPKIVGEAGHRDSMMFDHELDDTQPVVFDRRNADWRKGKWAEK